MESSLGMEWGIVERNIELGGVMRAKWGGGGGESGAQMRGIKSWV